MSINWGVSCGTCQVFSILVRNMLSFTVFETLSQAEINNVDLILCLVRATNEKVIWFDVSMYYSFLVHFLNAHQLNQTFIGKKVKFWMILRFSILSAVIHSKILPFVWRLAGQSWGQITVCKTKIGLQVMALADPSPWHGNVDLAQSCQFQYNKGQERKLKDCYIFWFNRKLTLATEFMD